MKRMNPYSTAQLACADNNKKKLVKLFTPFSRLALRALIGRFLGSDFLNQETRDTKSTHEFVKKSRRNRNVSSLNLRSFGP